MILAIALRPTVLLPALPKRFLRTLLLLISLGLPIAAATAL